MKKILIVIIAVFGSAATYAQSNELIGQYYLNMPSYNPAHTGVDNFLNISAGMRQQWTGFSGSPYNSFINAYGIVSTNKSKNDSLGTSAKHGIGGNVMKNAQGAYKQNEAALMYAYHIPVAKRTYLALGMSPTVYNEKIETSKLTIEDEINDATYQSLIGNGDSYTNLRLNAGLALYSDNFYVSYSLRNAASVTLSGNKDAFNKQSERRHHFMAGYTFHLNQTFDLIPNTFVRLDELRPALVEVGVRARADQNKWLGVSVRNDKTIVGSLGLLVRNKFSFGYAYEYKKFGMLSVSGGTHELVLGLQLRKM